jgi:hypothetical protein
VLEHAPREGHGGQSRYIEACLRMKSETEVADDFEIHLAEDSSGQVYPDLIAETAWPQRQCAAHAETLSVAEPGCIATFATHYEATAERLRQDEDSRITDLLDWPSRPQQAEGTAPPRWPGGGAGLRRRRGQCQDAGPLHRPACRLPAADL